MAPGNHPPGSWLSMNLSGIVNGFKQVSVFAGDASAVAVARTSTCETPKKRPISVGIGLLRAADRYTVTLTRFWTPDVGLVRDCTSDGPTDTVCAMTWLSCAAVTALWTAGPDAV